jgi:hypothetical protein
MSDDSDNVTFTITAPRRICGVVSGARFHRGVTTKDPRVANACAVLGFAVKNNATGLTVQKRPENRPEIVTGRYVGN